MADEKQPVEQKTVLQTTSLKTFRLESVMAPQISLIHEKCGNPSQLLTVQNTNDQTKPANALLICHFCKESEIVTAPEWDAILKSFQTRIQRADQSKRIPNAPEPAPQQV